MRIYKLPTCLNHKHTLLIYFLLRFSLAHLLPIALCHRALDRWRPLDQRWLDLWLVHQVRLLHTYVGLKKTVQLFFIEWVRVQQRIGVPCRRGWRRLVGFGHSEWLSVTVDQEHVIVVGCGRCQIRTAQAVDHIIAVKAFRRRVLEPGQASV